MRKYIFFIMICNFHIILAQKKYSVRVTDIYTKLPLQGAVVKYNNQHKETDDEGFFYITLSQTTDIDSIQVSYVGYKDRKIKLNNKGENQVLIIELTPETNNLDEVVVSSGIERLIRKCVDKIPINYAEDTIVLDGILDLNFRTEQINPIAYKRTEIGAAIETVYPKNNYNGSVPKVYLIENRNKTENSITQLKDTTRYTKNWYLPNDIVYNKTLFLDRKRIKNYSYQLQGKCKWGGRTVFNIAFESKKENKVKGFVLIDTATYTFVYFDYWLYDVKELFFKTIKQSHQRISYMLCDGKWYLDRVEINNDYKLEHGQIINHALKLYKTIRIKLLKDTALLSNDLVDLHEDARSYTKYVSNNNWVKYASLLNKLKSSSSDTLLININNNATDTVKNNNHFAGITHKHNGSIVSKLASYNIGASFTKLPVSFRGYQPSTGRQVSSISEYDFKISLMWELYKNDFFEINASNNFGIEGMKASQYGLFLGQTINLSKTQKLSPLFGYSNISLKEKSSGQKANFGYINFGIRYLPKLTTHLSLLFEGDYAKQLMQSHSLINVRNQAYSISIGILFSRFN